VRRFAPFAGSLAFEILLADFSFAIPRPAVDEMKSSIAASALPLSLG